MESIENQQTKFNAERDSPKRPLSGNKKRRDGDSTLAFYKSFCFSLRLPVSALSALNFVY